MSSLADDVEQRIHRIGSDALVAFLSRQRWTRGDSFVGVTISSVHVMEGEPVVAIALAEAYVALGTHTVYQLLLGMREPRGGEDAIATVDDVEIYDLGLEPGPLVQIVRAMRDDRTITGDDRSLVFTSSSADSVAPLPQDARLASGAGSNTSVIVDNRLILKCYRRLEPGLHPELEMLIALRDEGTRLVPGLLGSYEHRGGLMNTTLGVLQPFRSSAIDGWELVLSALREERGDSMLAVLEELGAATGRLHAALAGHSDPAFTPEDVDPQSVALSAATLDELIIEMFAQFPPDDPVLAPLRHRCDDVRMLAGRLSTASGLGRRIRVHGDLHLGQALWVGDHWEITDFEGEPDRSLIERRRKHSPLRDLAGLLRSIDYAAGAARIEGAEVPDRWARTAREVLTRGYIDAVEPTGLLPPTDAVRRELTALFELEKVLYEIGYERAHRPDWTSIPVEGLERMIGDDG